MLTIDKLEEVFGADAAAKLLTYVTNKHRGGVNNNKGNTFENFFAVYRIAQLLNADESKEQTRLTAQSLWFIDDLVVTLGARNISEYYQIKDIQALTWEGGRHPIREDFRCQSQFCNHGGMASTFGLVLSNEELVNTLNGSRPADINFVQVIHFITATSVSNLIRANPAIKGELTNLSAISNPSVVVLETIAASILGAWDSMSQQETLLGEVVEYCNNMSPHYMKGSGELVQSLKNVLNAIPGFTYEVENGFVKWKYRDTDEGILSFPIGSPEFVQWQSDVTNLGIKNVDFDKIEPYLQ